MLPDYSAPDPLTTTRNPALGRAVRRFFARAHRLPWSACALTRLAAPGPNRAARRAAMQAQGPVLSRFGLRNDAIRRDAQQRAAEAIKARAEATALPTGD